MTEEEFAEIVGRVNEAAVGLAPWAEVATAVASAFKCDNVTCLLGPPDGLSYVDLMADGARAEDGRPSIPARYRALDPSLPQSVAIAARRLDLKEVAHVFEMVPEGIFRRSEYYADFARREGFYHRLGFSGIRGGGQMAPFAIHRAERAAPFQEADRAALLRIKPHVKRALVARERYTFGMIAPRLGEPGAGIAALELCRDPALVVDAELRLMDASAAAQTLLCSAGAPLRVVTDQPGSPGRMRIAAAHGSETMALANLVRGVATGASPGGVLPLGPRGEGAPGYVVSAAPVPARLTDGARLPGTVPGVALIMLTNLRRVAHAPPALLSEIFSLSRAEAIVTIALLGGATAEAVAARRAVSVQTVRTQIRSVLNKVGATGLRDLERIIALLPR